MMPFENVPLSTGEGMDCYRRSLAYVFDMHPSRVPFYHPDKPSFWLDYSKWIRKKFGYLTLYYYDDDINRMKRLDEKWIACVPSLYNKNIDHAIVMNKDKFEYDCAKKARKRAPKKIYYGMRFVKII
jgi:hypothetical protein